MKERVGAAVVGPRMPHSWYRRNLLPITEARRFKEQRDAENTPDE